MRTTQPFWLSLACLLLASPAMAGKAEDLAAIKKRYAQAAELEQAGEAQHVVVFNTVLPAVGPQRTTVTFVFESRQRNPQRDPYDLIHELVKATTTYNVAASEQVRTEYLFDRAGKLIFCYRRSEGEGGLNESRTYLKAGQAIRVITDFKGPEAEQATRHVQDKLGDEMADEVKLMQAKASEYKQAFQQLLRLEQIK